MAALVTRGCTEMRRLVVVCGGGRSASLSHTHTYITRVIFSLSLSLSVSLSRRLARSLSPPSFPPSRFCPP
eukprot:6177043-Pleurochrysis_carterae.AAC.4